MTTGENPEVYQRLREGYRRKFPALRVISPDETGAPGFFRETDRCGRLVKVVDSSICSKINVE